jgi:translation initiation factor 2 subunit 2
MSDEEMENPEEVAEEEEEADLAAMLDLSKKKKKSKKKKEKGKDEDEDPDADKRVSADLPDSEQALRIREIDKTFDLIYPDEDDRKADYSYTELLDRVIDLLHSNNPDLIEKKRRNMKPPQLTRVGTKKTLWVNFQEICTMMQRPPEHVFQFFMAELGTEGSIDGSQRLVIRGKYVPKYIESLLRKYIVEYITCQMCRSPNTELKKDSSTRLQFCICKDCGSSRSVTAIRSGYHATSRADRRAARNAQA